MVTPVSSPTPDEQAAEERRAETQALLEVNATLHAKATHLETLLRTMDHFADVAEVCEAKSNDYAARLVASEASLVVVREQLTRVEAVADELRRKHDHGNSNGFKVTCALCYRDSQTEAAIRAALAPPTPPQPKEPT